MPIRLIDKWSVGETPTEATETVALPGTQKLSVNRIGMVHSIKIMMKINIRNRRPPFKNPSPAPIVC